MANNTALVLGAGGFIGSHMVKRLKKQGYWVRGVDLKHPEFSSTEADHFVLGDLRDAKLMKEIVGWAGVQRNPYETFALQFDQPFDEIYQFAADMGGAGFIFTGDHDADIMHNSAQINLNLLDAVVKQYATKKPRIFYSSSACIYPAHNQEDRLNPNCEESSAYPANPDSEYGWEKLFSERLYLSYARNYGLEVRIARYHNIYGPEGTWDGGREKAPAAICRKVALAQNEVEIWGDGEQTRSFLYIDACIDATRRLMGSDFTGPVNIGSEEQVTINQLVDITCKIAGKSLLKVHIPGPLGVRGRNSDNRLFRERLQWDPKYSLEEGIQQTYNWILKQITNRTKIMDEKGLKNLSSYVQHVQGYSQIGQDLFVLTCLKGLHKGRYVEIGASDPVNINNTYLMENKYGWQGVSLDIVPEIVFRFNQVRQNKAFLSDATTADYSTLFDRLSWNDTRVIDYASIDCEPPENTFRALMQLMISGYKFRVITFEHDTYQSTLPVKTMSRTLLSEMGYELIVGGVMGSETWHDQEDWWVHPELVDINHVRQYKCLDKNIYWKTYIHGKNH